MSTVIDVGTMSSYSMEDDEYSKEVTIESILKDFDSTMRELEDHNGGSSLEVEPSMEGIINLVGSIMAAIVKMVLNLAAAVVKVIAGIVVWIAKKISGGRDEVSLLRGSLDSLKKMKDNAFSVSAEDDMSNKDMVIGVATRNKSFENKQIDGLEYFKDLKNGIIKTSKLAAEIHVNSVEYIRELSDVEISVLKDISKSKSSEDMAAHFIKSVSTLEKNSTKKDMEASSKYKSIGDIVNNIYSSLKLSPKKINIRVNIKHKDLGSIIKCIHDILDTVDQEFKSIESIMVIADKQSKKHSKDLASLSKSLLKLDKNNPDFRKKHPVVLSRYNKAYAGLRSIKANYIATLTASLSIRSKIVNQELPYLDKSVRYFSDNTWS